MLRISTWPASKNGSPTAPVRCSRPNDRPCKVALPAGRNNERQRRRVQATQSRSQATVAVHVAPRLAHHHTDHEDHRAGQHDPSSASRCCGSSRRAPPAATHCRRPPRRASRPTPGPGVAGHARAWLLKELVRRCCLRWGGPGYAHLPPSGWVAPSQCGSRNPGALHTTCPSTGVPSSASRGRPSCNAPQPPAQFASQA